MRRLLSYSASLPITSFGLLILRIGFGGLLAVHGYDKLMHFAEMKANFISFLGMSPGMSLGLLVFAEFVCSLFVVLGLLTRFACVPVIIGMSVALIQAHGGDITGKGQPATLFLLAFLSLLFTGPGKYSLDAALYKHA
ncbi:MAG: DoxX family protein [Bacteroidota bacterium]